MKTAQFKAMIGSIVIAAGISTQAQQPVAGMVGGMTNAFLVNVSGFDVRDASGISAGRLESVIINPSGFIEMGVLAVGNRLVPVPWPLMSVSTDSRFGRPGQNTLFTVNLDHARLLQAPAFDRVRGPDFTQPNWSHQFFTFFGLPAPTMAGNAGLLNTNLFNNNLTNLLPTGRTNGFGGLTNLLPRTNNLGPAAPGAPGTLPPGPPQTAPPPLIPPQPIVPPPGTPLAPPGPVTPPPATPPSR